MVDGRLGCKNLISGSRDVGIITKARGARSENGKMTNPANEIILGLEGAISVN